MVLKEKDIAMLKSIISKALMDEWKAQGHFESGKIVDEIDYIIQQDLEQLSIIGNMYPYGVYQDTGVSASNIPYTRGSGAGKSKYIEGLISWVQRRMAVSELKEAKSIAFAIATTQKKEGMPTQGALSHSATGKRTEWVSDALQKNASQIGGFIRQFYMNFMVLEF